MNPETRAKLDKPDQPHKVILSCIRAGPVGAKAQIQYPRYCQVTVNGTFLKVVVINKIGEHSYSSGISKQISVDISSFVKTADASIKFSWSHDNQSYIAVAKLVRVNTPAQIIQKIVTTRTWTKEKVIEHQFKKKLEADDLIAGPDRESKCQSSHKNVNIFNALMEKPLF
jgi:hypothetical protein